MEQQEQQLPLSAWSPAFTAWYLASRLGDNEALWGYRLANWRQAARRPKGRPFVVPETGSKGEAIYRKEAVDLFLQDVVANRDQRQQAVADGVHVGATARVDGVDRRHVMLMVAAGPASKSIYQVDAHAAKALAQMLTKAAQLVEEADDHAALACAAGAQQ